MGRTLITDNLETCKEAGACQVFGQGGIHQADTQADGNLCRCGFADGRKGPNGPIAHTERELERDRHQGAFTCAALRTSVDSECISASRARALSSSAAGSRGNIPPASVPAAWTLTPNHFYMRFDGIDCLNSDILVKLANWTGKI